MSLNSFKILDSVEEIFNVPKVAVSLMFAVFIQSPVIVNNLAKSLFERLVVDEKDVNQLLVVDLNYAFENCAKVEVKNVVVWMDCVHLKNHFFQS